jgi:FkbM family methyltransferase
MTLRKYSYYLSSIVELLFNVRPLSTVFNIFLKSILRSPANVDRDAAPAEKIISLPHYKVSFKVRGAMDIWSVKETFLDRFYIKFGTPIGSGWTIVDIGGGIGDFTTFAAHSHASNTVFAFEPTPHSFRLLQENLERNAVNNASGYQQAIWSEEGTLWIDTTVGEPGQFISRDLPGQDPQEGAARNGSIPVPCISLVQALHGLGINRCDLLKMDCEGAEYSILFSTPAETLARIQRIVMEYHDGVNQYSHVDMARFLTEHGYSVHTEANFVHTTLGYLYADRT